MISERLEKLVEDMVDKGVHFEDAVREFEKRFIVRRFWAAATAASPRPPKRSASTATRSPGRWTSTGSNGGQDRQEGRDRQDDSACPPALPARPARSAPPYLVSTPPLTVPTAAHIISSRQERVLTRTVCTGLQDSAFVRQGSQTLERRRTQHERQTAARPHHRSAPRGRRTESRRDHHPRLRQGKAPAGQSHRRRQRQDEGRRQASSRSTSRRATPSCSASIPARKSSSMVRSTSSCAKTKCSPSSNDADKKKK